MYEILTKFDGIWCADGVGNTDNEFATEQEALDAIQDLKRLGEDWATAEYRVREIAE